MLSIACAALLLALKKVVMDLEVGADCKARQVWLRQTSVTCQHVFRQRAQAMGNHEGETKVAQG